MLSAAKWIMGVVPGGIVLGALLGAAADPDMKDPPDPWWRLTGNDQIAISNEQFVEAWPADLGIPTGYRPDLDYEAEVWALPVPAYDLAVLDEPPAMPAEPTVTYDTAATDAVADEAETAVEDALAAEASEPETAIGEIRKSELVDAGLY